jgi:hypothetical protein
MRPSRFHSTSMLPSSAGEMVGAGAGLAVIRHSSSELLNTKLATRTQVGRAHPVLPSPSQSSRSSRMRLDRSTAAVTGASSAGTFSTAGKSSFGMRNLEGIFHPHLPHRTRRHILCGSARSGMVPGLLMVLDDQSTQQVRSPCARAVALRHRKRGTVPAALRTFQGLVLAMPVHGQAARTCRWVPLITTVSHELGGRGCGVAANQESYPIPRRSSARSQRLRRPPFRSARSSDQRVSWMPA